MQIADSLRRGLHVLFIGRCNPDCMPDTILGSPTGFLAERGYLPRLVLWGRSSSGGNGCQDATVPAALRRVYTTITYPSLPALRGSASFISLNGDSLLDVVFVLRSTITLDGKTRDSTRLVAVFGQYSMSALATIDLAAVSSTFIASPFIAMELRKGAQLVAPAVRDLSGRTSYELPKIDYTITPPDTASHSLPAHVATVRVFPNPAATSANVEALAVPAGDYDVDVIATDGAVVVRRQVSLAVDGDLFGTLDVRRLPSGYYVVRLVRDGRSVGTYPVIVTR